MKSFTTWLDLVGDQVAKVRKRETGHSTLTFFTEEEEEWLDDVWRQGVKPKDAASKLLARRKRS